MECSLYYYGGGIYCCRLSYTSLTYLCIVGRNRARVRASSFYVCMIASPRRGKNKSTLGAF